MAAMEAVCVREIQKMEFMFDVSNWKSTERVVSSLGSFGDGITDRIRLRILESLEYLATFTRHRMSDSTATSIRRVVQEVLPFPILGKPRSRSLTIERRGLLQLTAQIGESLGYDGSLYLRSASVVDCGAQLLGRALAVAHAIGDRHLMSKIEGNFDTALDGAARSGDTDLPAILSAFRVQGRTGRSTYPELAGHLLNRIVVDSHKEYQR
jgi:hypothetical protein